MADPNFYATGTRVTIDGIDVTDLLDVSVSEQGKEFEDFDVLDDQFTRSVELDSYMANGTVRIKSKHNIYSSDPMGIGDFFSLIAGYSQYDTANDIIEMVFDSGDQTTTGLKGPPRIVEIRQTEATASTTIDDDATEEALAQQFIAAGEEIIAIKLKLREPVSTDLNSFDLEIWTDDGSDKPDAKLSSTNTVTVNCSAGSDDETNDYIGALTEAADYTGATWETIDMSASTPDILDGESLSIGTKYWLVIRNTAAAGEDLGVCYTTNNNFDGGLALGDDNIQSSPVWGDGPANITDLTFVIQFEASEGHTMRIYDYDTSSTGYYTQYNGVKFERAQVSPGAKKAQEATLNWTAQTVDGPTAFS